MELVSFLDILDSRFKDNSEKRPFNHGGTDKNKYIYIYRNWAIDELSDYTVHTMGRKKNAAIEDYIDIVSSFVDKMLYFSGKGGPSANIFAIAGIVAEEVLSFLEEIE